MLKDAVPSKGLKEIHDDYVRNLIKYFKIVDKTDIIQDQYDLDKGKDDNKDLVCEINEENILLLEANELMMKKPILNSTLNNYVVCTSTHASETRIIPVKLDIDLNSPSLKTKGIKAKKIKKSGLKDNLTT